VAGPLDVLARHVERFNDGVRSGDFGPMVEGFGDESELIFEGIPVGPFRGREAVAQAYRDQPPDDIIAVRDAQVSGDEVTAVYGWERDGYARAGEMRLAVDGDRIRRLVVTFDSPGVPGAASGADSPAGAVSSEGSDSPAGAG
jgi:steroid delta-isomerase